MPARRKSSGFSAGAENSKLDYWIFAHALVDKRHGLGIVSFHTDTFVHPRGAPATSCEKNREKLQIVNI